MSQFLSQIIPHINSSITYRNAIYQGQINEQNQTRKDFGIVYVAKTHEFICCNNWHNDNLEGECLFYNDHKQYVYGMWINNLPQGFNVFRFDQVLLMAEFNRGKLAKNSKVLIIFQKYNLAAVLLVLNDSDKLDDLEFEVFSKAQVFSPEDVKNIFHQCHWPHEYFIQSQTLIKYISHKLTHSSAKYEPNAKTQPKLRLIENKFYRFGYDQGLAIVFDQDFNRVSVGCHSKNMLKSFGIVFEQKPKPLIPYNKPEQGKIIKITLQKNQMQTLPNSQPKKSQIPQQNIKTNLLMGVNFCNKFFKNPSKIFASYVQNLISQQSIKKIIAGSLTTRRMFEESLNFSKIQQNHDVSSDLLDRDLKKTNGIAPITHQKERKQKSDKQKVTGDRLRLEAIKKQIYDSLQKRKHTVQHIVIDEDFQQEIIHKQIVGGNYKHTFMETPEREERSRSRRRIFEESEKNLKILRDFTPTRSEPSLTPFKTKMKNRIFNGEESKNSIGDAKNHSYESYSNQGKRRIFENEEAQINERNFDDRRISNEFSSKHSNAKEPRSKGKIRDLRNRDDITGRPIQRGAYKAQDRHVTFQDRNSFKDSLNANKNSKDTFESGNNVHYVPIDPNEERERKRSIQNHSSHKQSRNSNPEVSKQPLNINRNQNQYAGPQQRLTPKSRYYLEEKSSKNQSSRSFANQNQSEKSPIFISHDDNTPYERYDPREQRKRETPKQNNFVYQDDTFKHAKIPQQFQSNQLSTEKELDNEEKYKRPVFRNSNEVYLDQLKYKNSNKSTQIHGNYQERYQNPANRTMPYMPPLQDERSGSKDNYNNSYKVKHMMKKSIGKEIQRSPDRYRCYGKNMNNPYIQVSPKYSKEGTYMMSFDKYESPYTISRNDGYNMSSTMGRNHRGRMF